MILYQVYSTRRKFQGYETYRRFFAVNDEFQSQPSDGPTSGWRQRSVVDVVVVLVAEL